MHLDTADTSSADPIPGDDAPDQGIDAPDMQLFVFALFFIFGGITSLNDVCEDVRRITSATDVPLLVDADTGWGAAFNISRTIGDLIRSGAGACHLEDQVQAKRCGHARQGDGFLRLEAGGRRVVAAHGCALVLDYLTAPSRTKSSSSFCSYSW